MKLSKNEIQSQTLTEYHQASAIAQIQANGFVVFENAIDEDLLAELREEFSLEFLKYISATEPNRGPNRYQMHLPFRQPFCHESVVASPLVLPIIKSLLGDDCVCHYFASDTPLPGSEHQKVHMDIHHLFPEVAATTPVYGLVLNLPLVDFTEENGPLEIWPGGSHLIAPGADLQELAPRMKSQQLLIPAGSLVLRDMRMWHRGTPNMSNEPRPNLALIYARHWLNTKYPPIHIQQNVFDSLSEDARQLLRFEAIDAT